MIPDINEMENNGLFNRNLLPRLQKRHREQNASFSQNEIKQRQFVTEWYVFSRICFCIFV